MCATRRSCETTIRDAAGNALRITDFTPRFKRFERVFNPPQIFRRIEPLAGLPRITIRVRPTFNYGGPCATRAIGSNHIRYSGGADTLRLTTDARPLLHRPRDAVRADQARHPDPGAGRALRGGRRYRLARVPRAHPRLLARLGALARDPARVPGRDHPRRRSPSSCATSRRRAPSSPPTPPRSPRRRARSGPGTIATAGCATPSSSSRRSIAWAPPRPWKNTSTTSPTSPSRPSGRCGRSTASCPPSRWRSASPPTSRAFRACGPVRVGNQAAEQLQHDAYGSVILGASQMFIDERLPRMGDADLFRRLEPLGVQARRFALRARCGPLGVPRPPARAHALRHHVLGGVRPAGAHRRASGPRRPRRALARGGRRRCAIRS